MSSDENEDMSSDENENKNDDTPVYRRQLLETLDCVERISNYAYGASLHEFCLPRLNVPGIGPLSFPLYEHFVKAIIARCSQAPFGRGEETIIDTTVRNTWQLSPTEFTIENEHYWGGFVDKLAENIRIELGFSDAIIENKLYKLLVYEQGGFFSPHRDSEKEEGMFASLIIILPSSYEGGQLVIRHNGKEKEFDFGGVESSYTLNYAAFYTDCEHEVRPVTQGHRLCLVYNIINTGHDPTPFPSDNTALVKQIADLFRDWESDEDGPIKLVYLLEHRYTDVSLSFNNLKGYDRAVAQLMKQVQSYTGTMVSLANLKWGSTINITDYEERKEAFWKMNMAPCINADDERFGKKALGVFTKDQVLNLKSFNSLKPSDMHCAATGNEGAQVKRQYQATGLIFCPPKNSSIMKWDLMGANLSIAKMATISEAEGAHEQAQALLKSTALKPTYDRNLCLEFSKDPISSERLLVKLFTSLRQLHLVDVYLDTIKQNLGCVYLAPDLLSELIQGCSELGWTELSFAIRQHIKGLHLSQIFEYFQHMAFSLVPGDDQQRQSRSDLLDWTLIYIDDNISKDYCSFSPILIESLHHLGYHSKIGNFIEKLTVYWDKVEKFTVHPDKVEKVMDIIKATHTCLSCDSFEASIQPYLVNLIEKTIDDFKKMVSNRHPASGWERELRCKCNDCEQMKTFAHSPTARTQLTVRCNTRRRPATHHPSFPIFFSRYRTYRFY